jgi:Cytochrome bd terminal oxidase subunit II
VELLYKRDHSDDLNGSGCIEPLTVKEGVFRWTTSPFATFIQGVMVGALVEGLPVANGRYIGGEFGWLSPFAVICGVGLCLGYTLLGACWLVRKGEGELRESAYRLIHDFERHPRSRRCQARNADKYRRDFGIKPRWQAAR